MPGEWIAVKFGKIKKRSGYNFRDRFLKMSKTIVYKNEDEALFLTNFILRTRSIDHVRKLFML